MSPTLCIDGATRLYAIVGDPIAQVRSPAVFTDRFAAMGAPAVLLPVQVAEADFDAVMPALMRIGNLDGLLVTVPFKARALAYASRLGASAHVIGAINALKREADGRWTGDMFDGVGFVRAAQGKGLRVAKRKVLLFGAGGAGSAVACALAEAGVARINLVDPRTDRAEALAHRLRDGFSECRFVVGMADTADVDMVVNASTVGMRAEDGLPADIGPLAPGVLVGDVVVSQEPTALIRLAAQSGCATIDGRDMHSGQSDAIVDFFAPARASRGDQAA